MFLGALLARSKSMLKLRVSIALADASGFHCIFALKSEFEMAGVMKTISIAVNWDAAATKLFIAQNNSVT